MPWSSNALATLIKAQNDDGVYLTDARGLPQYGSCQLLAEFGLWFGPYENDTDPLTPAERNWLPDRAGITVNSHCYLLIQYTCLFRGTKWLNPHLHYRDRDASSAPRMYVDAYRYRPRVEALGGAVVTYGRRHASQAVLLLPFDRVADETVPADYADWLLRLVTGV